MRILLVNQYYWPDRAATAQLLTDLGEDLARHGHRVEVLASRGSYAPGRAGASPRRETRRGVSIRRLPATDFGRARLLGRLLDYLTFLVSAAVAVLFGPRRDVVVVLSTPPLVAAVGLLARWRGARFVSKVEDLYPDVAVALGALSDGSLPARLLATVSRRLLAAADAVVALDGAMARVLARRGARRVEVIPNWADGEALDPATHREAGEAWRREHGIPADAFLVLYSGNLGNAHRFDAVVEAVRELDAEGTSRPGGADPDAAPLNTTTPAVVFLFVGAGPRLASVRDALEDLSTVRFLPYQPRETLGSLYAAADLHLVTLRDEVAGLLVPSKVAAALGAGRPVLLVGGTGTDLQAEIRREEVGWAVPHESRRVVEAVRAVRDESDRLPDTGDNPGSPGVETPRRGGPRGVRARQLFEARYSRRRATGAWARLLETVAGSHTDTP